MIEFVCVHVCGLDYGCIHGYYHWLHAYLRAYDVTDQVQDTCMVCLSCENAWMFVTWSAKQLVAMVTVCLWVLDLFVTLRFTRAKVHIICTTAWVTLCLLVLPWCNCSKLPTVLASHYKLWAHLWNITVPTVFAIKLPFTSTAYRVILSFVPVSYLAWRCSY